MRSKNLSYAEINKQGGGINSSISHVRNSSFQELYDSCYNNIKSFIDFGTTTIEAKSGYGLTLEDEIKSLEIINKVNNDLNIDIVPTFLGAHSIPPEFANNRSSYINIICDEMIPAVAKDNLAVFCDIFCEEGYFTIKESEKILNIAKSFGLIPKIHADEFNYFGASKLAKDIGAISADHLMAINNEGIDALSSSNVIATLLPGTTFFLKKRKYADGRVLIDRGCEVALATDFNPGTCTIRSLPIIMLLAINYCGMTIEESFKAVTYNAAKAIGKDNIGRIDPGCQADLIFWNLNSINEIPYWFDSSITKINNVMKNGKIINTN
jgi:imidazolonepropionase